MKCLIPVFAVFSDKLCQTKNAIDNVGIVKGIILVKRKNMCLLNPVANLSVMLELMGGSILVKRKNVYLHNTKAYSEGEEMTGTGIAYYSLPLKILKKAAPLLAVGVSL